MLTAKSKRRLKISMAKIHTPGVCILVYQAVAVAFSILDLINNSPS